MNIRTVIDLLHSGAQFAHDMVPASIVSAVPFVSEAITIVDAITTVATNVMDRIDDGTVVATSQEVDELKDIIAKLAPINDALAAQIAAS
jgi:hypothetical protein